MIGAWPCLSRSAIPTTQPSNDTRINQAIQLLGSPDPTEREQAQQALVELESQDDLAVRAALNAAKNSDDPAIAQGAAGEFNLFPWYEPSDPPEIRDLLKDYGALPVYPQGLGDGNSRLGVINRLSTQGDAGVKAMFRIIIRESTDNARWLLMDHIARSVTPARLAAARALPVDWDSAPLLTLEGWGWFELDMVKSTNYFQRAFDLLRASPQDAGSDLLFLTGQLYRGDRQLHRNAQAAEVLRMEISQNPRNDGPIFDLFALHAEAGPLPGYDADLTLAGAKLDSPLLLYCRSRIATRMMDLEQAETYRLQALKAAALSPQVARETAFALTDRGWYDFAEPQLNAFIAMGPNLDETSEMGARLRLANIYTSRGDYAKAAEAQKLIVQYFAGGQATPLHYVDPGDGYDHVKDSAGISSDWLLAKLKSAVASNDTADRSRRSGEIRPQ
jgi:tetratricopeptide (TPR) repeat protein